MMPRTARPRRWRRVAGACAGAVPVVLLTLCGCGSTSGKDTSGAAGSEETTRRVAVVASTNVYGDVVAQIARGAGSSTVAVTNIISDPDQDPHSYEADAATQLSLSKADLVIENGGGYDDFVNSMLSGAGNHRARVINVVQLSGKKAPAGGELNEHVWYDLPTVQKLSGVIATALSRLDPADAATYSANQRAFAARLDALRAQERSIRSAHAGAGVAITEPVPLYLLDASGLVNRTPPQFSEAVEDGTDAPVSVLNTTLQLFRSHAVKLLAYNEQTADPETQKVLAEARADGVPVVPVTETLPAGMDYVSWMAGNLRALRAALG